MCHIQYMFYCSSKVTQNLNLKPTSTVYYKAVKNNIRLLSA